MFIGILSDTHDRADAMAAGMKILADAGAEFFIHCGDVGGERVLDHLAGVKAAFVWGNTDWDRAALQRYAQKLDIVCYGSFGELSLDGKLIALMHGDDAKLKRRVLNEQRHDYLLLGHTHQATQERVGRVHVINPGALHRAVPRTVALLDTRGDHVSFHIVLPG